MRRRSEITEGNGLNPGVFKVAKKCVSAQSQFAFPGKAGSKHALPGL